MDELELNRENTAAFIAARPTQIVLTPVKRTRTGTKGFKDEDQPVRKVQTFRIIENGAPRNPVTRGENGTQREVDFMLLGLHDAIVEVNDHWETDGRQWRVDEVVRSNGYEQRALVVERGR
jgi:hypothetical protein